MSRWQCPHCQEMHSTTAYPNKIEGHFVSDTAASNVGKVDDLESWLELRPRAYHCPTCSIVTLEEDAE